MCRTSRPMQMQYKLSQAIIIHWGHLLACLTTLVSADSPTSLAVFFSNCFFRSTYFTSDLSVEQWNVAGLLSLVNVEKLM